MLTLGHSESLCLFKGRSWRPRRVATRTSDGNITLVVNPNQSWLLCVTHGSSESLAHWVTPTASIRSTGSLFTVLMHEEDDDFLDTKVMFDHTCQDFTEACEFVVHCLWTGSGEKMRCVFSCGAVSVVPPAVLVSAFLRHIAEQRVDAVAEASELDGVLERRLRKFEVCRGRGILDVQDMAYQLAARKCSSVIIVRAEGRGPIAFVDVRGPIPTRFSPGVNSIVIVHVSNDDSESTVSGLRFARAWRPPRPSECGVEIDPRSRRSSSASVADCGDSPGTPHPDT